MKFAKSYDNLARWYAWLERLAFGRLLTLVRQDVLANVLNDLKAGQRLLVLGEGDGRFLQRFSRQCQVACQVDCVDNSSAMLKQAQTRLTNNKITGNKITDNKLADNKLTGNQLLEVNFIHADVTCGIPTEGQYDAVVSVFFLDNFAAKTLEPLTYNITNKLHPGGRWYVADFRVGKKRLHNQLWLWVMYRFFRLTTDIEANTLVDPTRWLEARLRLTKRRRWRGGFLVSETWQRLPRASPSTTP